MVVKSSKGIRDYKSVVFGMDMVIQNLYLCMKYYHVSITSIVIINCTAIMKVGGCFCSAPPSSLITCGSRECQHFMNIGVDDE
jgi:hypothetical protein